MQTVEPGVYARFVTYRVSAPANSDRSGVPGQRDVIDRILTHCGLSSRAPPAEARGPPEPSIPKLTYVSDLEFADDPGPAEPVGSAD
ncbi:MAG: hypothetical protein ACYS15_17525 [Planctomycetota bacterium]|jgi:hypothetical protein